MHHKMNKHVLIPLIAWNQFAKSMSLWKAAKKNDRGWFLLLAFTNTAGILDMIYLHKDKNRRKSYLDKLYP